MCRRVAAKLETQQMGQLPANRVRSNPVFSVTGIDFAGPFLLKKGHTRKPVIIKAYLCVFICFSTKATRLEVVSHVSTEAFLSCLKRFISRRGVPFDINTDNVSNFRGASHDLADLNKFLQQDSTQSVVHSYLLSQRIKWVFSPERAPHFGGLWEVAVKSAKFHLKRVIGTQHLDIKSLQLLHAKLKVALIAGLFCPLAATHQMGWRHSHLGTSSSLGNLSVPTLRPISRNLPLFYVAGQSARTWLNTLGSGGPANTSSSFND